MQSDNNAVASAYMFIKRKYEGSNKPKGSLWQFTQKPFPNRYYTLK